jgi:hypothetical protein
MKGELSMSESRAAAGAEGARPTRAAENAHAAKQPRYGKNGRGAVECIIYLNPARE